MTDAVRVNREELEKLPLSDLYALFDSLEGLYRNVNFFDEKDIVTSEIDKRVKLIFPDFDKFKESEA
jgi:hypothetical protein